MSIIVLSALLISFIIYLIIGISNWKHTKFLSDMLPLEFGKTASVRSKKEFSASTVATTISLATVVLAYFELSSYFGLWLLWTAVTTCIGLAVVSMASRKIWSKLSTYDHRPSLHEYLGAEYNSKSIAFIGALCTSIGFLLIYATELIVGSQFLANLIPQIPQEITVVVLSLVGFVYTVLGGFRAVVKTDQIQMKFIWIFIIMMILYFLYHIISHNGFESNLNKLPKQMWNFENRPGLTSFLFGIAVMNIPLFISNMSIWQRIAGSNNAEVVSKGLKGSVYSSLISWSLLAVIACGAYLIVTPKSNTTLFTDLLIAISNNIFGQVVVFFTVLGLYGAMLSTASTNLIVVAHTLYEDIYSPFSKRKLQTRLNSKTELFKSRIILIISAILATLLVFGLKSIGFSVADLAFSIYGGGLALCPPILFSLVLSKKNLSYLRMSAVFSIVLGFFGGWSAAFYGKMNNDTNLIFLAPCISFGLSLLVMTVGYLLNKTLHHENNVLKPGPDKQV